MRKQGYSYEIQERFDICFCGNPGNVFNVLGDNSLPSSDPQDRWNLCARHKLERDRIGLLLFAAQYVIVRLELEKRGFKNTADQARKILQAETFM